MSSPSVIGSGATAEMVAGRRAVGKAVGRESARDIALPRVLRLGGCPGLQETSAVDDEARARDEVGTREVEHRFGHVLRRSGPAEQRLGCAPLLLSGLD